MDFHCLSVYKHRLFVGLFWVCAGLSNFSIKSDHPCFENATHITFGNPPSSLCYHGSFVKVKIALYISDSYYLCPTLPCFIFFKNDIFFFFCVSGAPTVVLWRWQAWRLWHVCCWPARSSRPTWCSARSSRSTRCRRTPRGWANSWLVHLRVKGLKS